jgi:hypothetical protein
MGDNIQILIFIIIGLILLWLGFTLFFGPMSPLYPHLPWRKKKNSKTANGKAQICPLCSYKVLKGEQVKTVVFPPKPGSKDCIMHIKGCYSCLEDDKPRKCPVCKTALSREDFLVARMFVRSFQKNHIHVLGCNKCRKTGNI